MILKQFQKDGVEWMMNQETSGMMLGGILADDMGLGKTAQAVKLVARRAEIGKTLIVCPNSVIGHWQAELNRFEFASGGVKTTSCRSQGGFVFLPTEHRSRSLDSTKDGLPPHDTKASDYSPAEWTDSLRFQFKGS